jgi:1,3-propanediol dehydrogenase
MNGLLLVPETVRYGEGVFEDVGKVVKGYGSHVLLVSDPVMEKLGVIDRTVRLLHAAGLKVAVYSDISQEPTLDNVRDGLAVLKRESCDVVLAVGGGSCIDTGKAVAVMAVNPGQLADYLGDAPFVRPPLPLVCAPTTAGTGSEVTRVTVITDAERDIKMMISKPELLPKAALVDPRLTLSCPPSVTAATGVDAICHAVEAYLSRKAHPLTDAIAIGAVRLMADSLLAVYEDGSDLSARAKMSVGSMMAGIAFSNASVTLVHGMSRPIGALFHVPHGISNAMLLPAVLEFTSADPEAVRRLGDIGAALYPELAGAGVEERAKAAMRRLKELCRKLNIPNLSGWGIDRARFMSALNKMAADAIASGSPGNNLRVPDQDEIVALYRVCYDYDMAKDITFGE